MCGIEHDRGVLIGLGKIAGLSGTQEEHGTLVSCLPKARPGHADVSLPPGFCASQNRGVESRSQGMR